MKVKKRSPKLMGNKLFTNIVYCLLSCAIWPLLILIIPLFVVTKQVVNAVLKRQYGQSFGEILQSGDAVWAIEDISKSIVNVIVLISVKQSRSQDLTRQIKEIFADKIFNQLRDCPKLTSIRLRSMGFNFLLKNRITVDDCVSTLNVDTDVLDETLLQEIVSECSNKPLPKENSALWEVLVSPKPIKRDSNEAKIQTFPVLFRFSHIVGDGFALTNLLLRTFVDDASQLPSSEYLIHINQNSAEVKAGHIRTLPQLLLFIKNILYSLFVILIGPMVILHQTYIRKEDINALHGPNLSGEKLLVWSAEDKHKLVSAVKTIKRRTPGCSFSDVLLTAISGSLDKHFRHDSQFIPDSITTLVLALLPNMDGKPILQNQFSVALLDLPVLIEPNSLKLRLEQVMKRTNELRNSPDFLINYWLLQMFCGVIPTPVLQQTINTSKISMSFSNLPGLPKLSIFNGCAVEDIIFYTPHRGTAGVGLSVLTYDNRFQLGLTIDKSILSSKDKAQLILDDIFEEINLLHDEVCQTLPTKW